MRWEDIFFLRRLGGSRRDFEKKEKAGVERWLFESIEPIDLSFDVSLTSSLSGLCNA